MFLFPLCKHGIKTLTDIYITRNMQQPHDITTALTDAEFRCRKRDIYFKAEKLKANSMPTVNKR